MTAWACWSAWPGVRPTYLARADPPGRQKAGWPWWTPCRTGWIYPRRPRRTATPRPDSDLVDAGRSRRLLAAAQGRPAGLPPARQRRQAKYWPVEVEGSACGSIPAVLGKPRREGGRASWPSASRAGWTVSCRSARPGIAKSKARIGRHAAVRAEGRHRPLASPADRRRPATRARPASRRLVAA
jgi:hypothetical protein